MTDFTMYFDGNQKSIGRNTSVKRRNDWKKAKRKFNILKHKFLYEDEWLRPLHYYSKNKIHCSCPMCAMKRKFGDIPIYEQRAKEKMDSMMNEWVMEGSY